MLSKDIGLKISAVRRRGALQVIFEGNGHFSNKRVQIFDYPSTAGVFHCFTLQ